MSLGLFEPLTNILGTLGYSTSEVQPMPLCRIILALKIQENVILWALALFIERKTIQYNQLNENHLLAQYLWKRP